MIYVFISIINRSSTPFSQKFSDTNKMIFLNTSLITNGMIVPDSPYYWTIIGCFFVYHMSITVSRLGSIEICCAQIDYIIWLFKFLFFALICALYICSPNLSESFITFIIFHTVLKFLYSTSVNALADIT